MMKPINLWPEPMISSFAMIVFIMLWPCMAVRSMHAKMCEYKCMSMHLTISSWKGSRLANSGKVKPSVDRIFSPTGPYVSLTRER